MTATNNPPKKQEWFKISFVLIFVSSFIMLAIGFALQRVHQDNQRLEAFLGNAQNVQVDFENSLSVYTGNIQESLDYLSSLRPQNESGYIAFITQVEDRASVYGLDLDIQTSDKSLKPDSSGSYYVDYRLTFYANPDQLWSFTKVLEEMPYFVRVVDMDYASLENSTLQREFALPNVSLTIRLYVK